MNVLSFKLDFSLTQKFAYEYSFVQLKIPLALPIMMLGLNQTTMYGIAMLAIAALVGTNGLEQVVYIG